MAQDAVDILWEGQEDHQHAMIIGNAGSQYRGECSCWAQGPRRLEQIQEWAQLVQHCHVSSNNEESECVTFADGILCVKVEGVQQLHKMDIDNGNIFETETDEPSKVEPARSRRVLAGAACDAGRCCNSTRSCRVLAGDACDAGRFCTSTRSRRVLAGARVQVDPSRQAEEKSEDRVRKACPFTECRIRHGPPGTLEVVYAQVNCRRVGGRSRIGSPSLKGCRECLISIHRRSSELLNTASSQRGRYKQQAE